MTDFLLNYAHVKVDLLESIALHDVKFGARIARLKAVLKRAEARMTPSVRRAIGKAENEIGGLRRIEVMNFVGSVLRKISQPKNVRY